MAKTKPFHILIAENNHADVMLVKEAPTLHGVECEMAVIRDGAEAVGYFRELDFNSRSPLPDLVLLDMHLAKCDGEEILEALRSTERIAQTRVVIMTSYTAFEVEKVAQKHAAMHNSKKPSNWVEFSDLGNIVQNLLEGSKRATAKPLQARREQLPEPDSMQHLPCRTAESLHFACFCSGSSGNTGSAIVR